MKRLSIKYVLPTLTVVVLGVWSVAVNLPNQFQAGEVISAGQMNESLAALDTAKQERVEGECAEGSSIRAIHLDGTVECELDDVASGGGAAGVTSVVAGEGLVGGGDSGAVALALDPAVAQLRVSGSCASGSAVRAILDDGSVECEVDDIGSGGGARAWTA